MFEPLMIQLFLGLYFIGVGLPSATSSARNSFSAYAQVIFGLVLTGLAILHIALVK